MDAGQPKNPSRVPSVLGAIEPNPAGLPRVIHPIGGLPVGRPEPGVRNMSDQDDAASVEVPADGTYLDQHGDPFQFHKGDRLHPAAARRFPDLVKRQDAPIAGVDDVRAVPGAPENRALPGAPQNRAKAGKPAKAPDEGK